MNGILKKYNENWKIACESSSESFFCINRKNKEENFSHLLLTSTFDGKVSKI